MTECPPYKETKCKICGCQDRPLFFMQPPKDMEDFFCEEHRIEERKKRTEVKNG